MHTHIVKKLFWRTNYYLNAVCSNELIQIILFIVVPTVAIAKIAESTTEVAVVLAAQIMTYILCTAAWSITTNTNVKKSIHTAVALISTAYYGLIIFLSVFIVSTGMEFDPFLVLESWQEVLPALFGEYIVLKTVITAIGSALFLRYLYQLNHSFKETYCYTLFHQKRLLSTVVATITLLCISFVPNSYTLLGAQITMVEARLEQLEYKQKVTEFTNSYLESATDNIVIVQLESTSALTFNGDAVVGASQEAYPNVQMPELEKLKKDGIFMPYFWGNAIQTNRGIEAILCGVAGNIGAAYSQRLKDLTFPCLPEVLQEAGYNTHAFRADDLSFSNMGKFLIKTGFDAVHREDIMKEEDKEYQWGYDDCALYKRSLDYLQKNYKNPKKLFSYTEVSTNHWSFAEKEAYKHLYPYPEPDRFIERYINSATMQDYCLGQFYKQFKQYAPKNTHLFILGDHSWPVDINGNVYSNKGAETDNFLIPMLYIPPKERAKQYPVGKEYNHLNFAQTDLIATIFEILTGSVAQNSFADILKDVTKTTKDLEAYEPCHVMTQPYGEKLYLVAKWPLALRYSIGNKVLDYYDLEHDFLMKKPFKTEANVAYADFMQQHYCQRF